jgi:hypothetical protein
MKLLRLTCGGIEADAEGVEALANACAVVRWLLDDYKTVSEPRRSVAIEALSEVLEIVECAVSRERETRDETRGESTSREGQGDAHLRWCSGRA